MDTTLQSSLRVWALCLAGWACGPTTAYAQDVTGTLNTAWESFWQQSGYPRPLFKWHTPLRVRFSGVSAERHKDATLRHLREVAEHAGLTVSEAAADDTTASVQVEYFGTTAPLPANQPCVSNVTFRNRAIVSATIRANDDAVWRCMLHETMHLMGFPGHPLYHSVLTYFARSGQLTAVDKLLLRTLYAPEVVSGVSPFAMLEILARRLVDDSGDADKGSARQAADTFLRRTIREMEAFGNGTGEAPSVIVRSGKATQQGLERGQVEVQFFLGLAYLRGHVVAPDKEKALGWLRKAADTHGGAAALLKTAAGQTGNIEGETRSGAAAKHN